MSRRVAIFVLFVIAAPARSHPAARLSVSYLAPRAGVTGAPADYIDEMRAVVARVDRELTLPRALAVEYRDCGTANAYYYTTQHAVVICHELWDARRRRYTAAGLAVDEVDKLLRNAMTFTFFHEFAHALHHELDLPLVGSTEDAADEIATRLMIRLGHADAAAQAARSHSMRTDRHEFWDEHGSGPQRGFAIACLLYGADRARHASLMTAVPEPRRAKCIADDAGRAAAWTALLGRYVRAISAS